MMQPANHEIHRQPDQTVEEYLQIVVSVHRQDLAQAVGQFLAERQHKAAAKDDQRAQLCVDLVNATNV